MTDKDYLAVDKIAYLLFHPWSNYTLGDIFFLENKKEVQRRIKDFSNLLLEQYKGGIVLKSTYWDILPIKNTNELSEAIHLSYKELKKEIKKYKDFHYNQFNLLDEGVTRSEYYFVKSKNEEENKLVYYILIVENENEFNQAINWILPNNNLTLLEKEQIFILED